MFKSSTSSISSSVSGSESGTILLNSSKGTLSSTKRKFTSLAISY